MIVKEFGYREVRIERPLRLNFVINQERLDKLRDEKAFLKLEENEKEELIKLFSNHISYQIQSLHILLVIL